MTSIIVEVLWGESFVIERVIWPNNQAKIDHKTSKILKIIIFAPNWDILQPNLINIAIKYFYVVFGSYLEIFGPINMT